MRKLWILFIVLLSAISAKADDTATVQAAVTAGTLTRGTYNVGSTITLNHSFNGNGSTINYTASSGKCFNVTVASITIQNVHLTGISDVSNPSGTSGIACITHDNVTLTNVICNHFTAYGIYFQDSNNPTVTNSKVYDTGYIGMFFFIFTAGTYHGGTLNTDTIDRSMLSNTLTTGTTQGAWQIKGITSTGIYKKWTVSNIIASMPSNPVDWTAEGCEINSADSSTFTNIKVTGGSIAVSIVKNNRFVMNGTNTFDGQNNEALEYGGSTHVFVTGCSIINQLQDGVLTDPDAGLGIPATNDTLTNSTVTNPARFCFYTTQSSASFYTSGCTFTCSATSPCVEMNNADGYTFNNCSFLGASHATYAFEFEGTSTGNLSVSNSTISNITTKLLHFTTGGTVTADNINFTCMTYTSVILSWNVFGSYTIGSNVNLNLSCYTKGKLFLSPKGLLH